jgi:peptidoglycan/xylan/chitin deacetylase (PgdA/CDA1 family)
VKVLRLNGTPILLYHGLTPFVQGDGKKRFWVSARQFSAHLGLIQERGYKTKLLAELSNVMNGHGRSVVLTFDDGRATDYDLAFRLLLEAGRQAEFFLNTANIGSTGYLTWRQVDEMQLAGMSFQSHGHEHLDLSRLGAAELQDQLHRSKRILEDRLGCSVGFLAVPYGQLNVRLVEEARRAGYLGVCGSRCWPAQSVTRVLSRVPIYGTSTLGDIQSALACDPLFYGLGAARALAVSLPKAVMLRFCPGTVEGWRRRHE